MEQRYSHELWFGPIMCLPFDSARRCARKYALIVSALLAIAIGILFPSGCHAQTATDAHGRLQALISQEWEHRLKTYPEFATAVGDNRYNDKLTDYSAQAIAREAEHDRRILDDLQRIDPSELSKEDQLDRTLMLRAVQTRVQDERFKNWEMPVDQMNGPHLEYASLAKDMPFKTARDYNNYLTRLRGLPNLFVQLTANMRLGMRDHLMPPRYLLEKVAVEAADVANRPVDQSPFTEPLRNLPKDLSSTEKARTTAAIQETVGKQVLPAYAEFARFVKSEYAPNGRSEFGIWSLPDGAARYRQAIHEMTTTDMNPADVHALGLRQVADIERDARGRAQTRLRRSEIVQLAHFERPGALWQIGRADSIALSALHQSNVCETTSILRSPPEKQIDRGPDGSLSRAERGPRRLLYWRRRWLAPGPHQRQRVRTYASASVEC